MNYTDDEIQSELRMSSSTRNVSFRYDLLNRHDFAIGVLDNVTKAHISYGDFRTIKRSATFSLNEHDSNQIDFMSNSIQPWFILHMQKGGTVEFPLGIFHLQSPEKSTDRNITTRDIGAYDKLIFIERDKFTSRFLIAKGESYVGAVNRILHTSNIVKMNIPDNGVLVASDREFPLGTKKHLACNELLKAINYNTLWVDTDGFMRSEPYSAPSQRNIAHIYSSVRDSIVAPVFREKLDIAERHNIFIRVALNVNNPQELISVFENDDPLSPISTVNTMRSVDYDEIQDISSQEALDALVHRLAVESTTAFTHLSFKTALMPTHGGGDILLCDFPELWDTPRRFTETSWEMPLVYDGLMTHEARMVVRL